MSKRQVVLAIGIVSSAALISTFQNCAKPMGVKSATVGTQSSSSTGTGGSTSNAGGLGSGVTALPGGTSGTTTTGNSGSGASGTTSGTAASGSTGGASAINSNCSLSVAQNTVGFGQKLSYTLNVNRDVYPTANKAYWQGTRNTLQDGWGKYATESILLSSGPNYLYSADDSNTGVFTRSAIVTDANGTKLCETNVVPSTVVSRTARTEACILRLNIAGDANPDGKPNTWGNYDLFSMYTLKPTSAISMSARVEVVNQYGVAASEAILNTYKFVWGGRDKMAADSAYHDVYYNGDETQYNQATMSNVNPDVNPTFVEGAAYGLGPELAGNTYIRSAQVFDESGRFICRTNQVQIYVQKP